MLSDNEDRGLFSNRKRLIGYNINNINNNNPQSVAKICLQRVCLGLGGETSASPETGHETKEIHVKLIIDL